MSRKKAKMLFWAALVVLAYIPYLIQSAPAGDTRGKRPRNGFVRASLRRPRAPSGAVSSLSGELGISP